MGGSARFLGGAGGKIGLNVEKWSFSQGLRREFSRLPLEHKNTLFYTFSDQIPYPQSSKSTKEESKTCIFGQISNSSLIFYPLPLPILGLSFKFYYAPCPVIIEATLAKISFSKLMPIQSYRRKTLGGRLDPPPPFGIRRVNIC